MAQGIGCLDGWFMQAWKVCLLLWLDGEFYKYQFDEVDRCTSMSTVPLLISSPFALSITEERCWSLLHYYWIYLFPLFSSFPSDCLMVCGLAHTHLRLIGLRETASTSLWNAFFVSGHFHSLKCAVIEIYRAPQPSLISVIKLGLPPHVTLA